jgi:hypothetical protein
MDDLRCRRRDARLDAAQDLVEAFAFGGAVIHEDYLRFGTD